MFLLISCKTVLALLLLGAAQISVSYADGEDTLQLLHVLFRHGDRTTDAGIPYPTDPYANETYWPYGRGQLTNAGKLREYNLGLQLRQRYDSFLGDLYFQGIVDARSTDVNRTKASLELVLASLYPPNARLRWNWFLNWQAIPFNYFPTTNDPILYGFGSPNLGTYLADYFATEDYLTRAAPYADLLNYIAENAGSTYTFYTGGFFHFALETEDEWGFKLPAWTDPIYPDATYQLTTEYYKTLTATTDLKKLIAGGLLQKIVSDTQSKLAGTLEDTKIFLYSAHEMNVGTLLNTLGVFYPQIPQYGSYVTLEVHTIDNNNYIKVLFQNYTRTEPYELQLPSCDLYCPFDQFVSLVEGFFPDEDTFGSS